MQFGYFPKIFLKRLHINVFNNCTFLIFEPSSVINFKTTSLEIFILSCIFLLLVNDYSKSKYDVSNFLPFCLNFGKIKFPNIAFCWIFDCKLQIDFPIPQTNQKINYFLFGIIIAQPMILT